MAFVRPRDTTVPEVGRAREPFVRPFSTTIPNYNTTPLYIFFEVLSGTKYYCLYCNWDAMVHARMCDTLTFVACRAEISTVPVHDACMCCATVVSYAAACIHSARCSAHVRPPRLDVSSFSSRVHAIVSRNGSDTWQYSNSSQRTFIIESTQPHSTHQNCNRDLLWQTRSHRRDSR